MKRVIGIGGIEPTPVRRTLQRPMVSRTVARALVLAIAVHGCLNAEQPSSSVLAEARRELEARGRADQDVREGAGAGGQIDSAQFAAMARIDSANTEWVKTYIARWGWPTSAQVGPGAVRAAFLIVQHATHDTAFMRAMLPSIRESHRRGELNGGAVAVLIDRLEVKAGRPQIYGTHLSLREGRWVLDPVVDSLRVDERRHSLGLPPLAEYLRVVDSVMRAPD
ncbi:MAG: DUF6624 domain-containing protein [Gemmatimonadaceae bacterium]